MAGCQTHTGLILIIKTSISRWTDMLIVQRNQSVRMVNDLMIFCSRWGIRLVQQQVRKPVFVVVFVPVLMSSQVWMTYTLIDEINVRFN